MVARAAAEENGSPWAAACRWLLGRGGGHEGHGGCAGATAMLESKK